MFTPLDQNVIFLDTEFSSLDPYAGELLSVALIKPDGEEFYIEIEHDGPVSPFVAEHVLPFMTGPKLSREEARARINAFVGPGKPRILSYVDCYDALYLYKLFGKDDEHGEAHPFYWQPLDLASMLFACGADLGAGYIEFARRIGLEPDPGHRPHHALDDTRLVRRIYLRLISGDVDLASLRGVQ